MRLNEYEVQQERQEIRQEQYFASIESELEELEERIDEKEILEIQIFKMQEKLEVLNSEIKEEIENQIVQSEDVDGFDFSDEMQNKIDELGV